MKTKNLMLLALISVSIFSKNCYAQQVQLTVTQVAGFPVLPNDTAYQDTLYNFTVHVSNLGGGIVQVFDTMRVFLRNTDSTLINEEILGSLYIDSLIGQDTFSIQVNNYQFTTDTYKAGNNIVVVWPRIGGNVATTFDSLEIDSVYFDLLDAFVPILAFETYSIYPNPVTDIISIKSISPNSIEYVRILNDIGQEVLFRRTFEGRLDVWFLSEGFYFFEIRERNGTIIRKKFLKL